MANTTPRNNGTDIATYSDDLDTSDFDDGFDDLDDDNDSPIEDELETDDETDGESAEDDDLEPEDVDDQDEAEDDDSEQSDEDEEADDQSDNESDNQDDELVEMADGQEVTFGELKKGYLRQQDYTRKQNFYNERMQSVEGQGELLQNQATVLAEFIAQNLPPQPDQQLAFTDPNAHYQQQVAYNNAQDQLKQLLEIAGNVKKANEGTAQIKSDEELRGEFESLKSLYPKDFKNDKLKTAFFKTTFDAAKAAGFSDEEVRSNTDHRLFVLARKAYLFDQMQKKATSDEQGDGDGKTVVKTKRRRRFTPSKKNAAARNKIGISSRRQKARARLERDDSIENATALLSS